MGQVRLLAYFIAEGSLTRGTPGFTNTDPEIVEDFSQQIAELFPTLHIRCHDITLPMFDEGSIDTIVMCSIMHEVFSYNGYDYSAVSDAETDISGLVTRRTSTVVSSITSSAAMPAAIAMFWMACDSIVS